MPLLGPDLEEKGFDLGLAFVFGDANFRQILKELNLYPVITSQGLYVKEGMKKINPDGLLETLQGEKIRSQKIIITAPLPQSLELLEKNHIEIHDEKLLETISYHKALTCLLSSELHRNSRLFIPLA